MSEKKNEVKAAIKAHLDALAQKDPLFAAAYPGAWRTVHV